MSRAPAPSGCARSCSTVTACTRASPTGSTRSWPSPRRWACPRRREPRSRRRCAASRRPPILRELTDRSIARDRPPGERQAGAEEKRRRILDAAVHVFARNGFHTSRVGDIAEQAGVAHGLLYHYFASKDEVLQTLFRENW